MDPIKVLNDSWKGGKPLDLGELLRNEELGRQRRIEELKTISKPLHELVVSEEFLIEEILGQSHAHSFTPISEVRFGGNSPQYEGGYSYDITMKVFSKGKGPVGIPVRTIYFEGNFPGLAGNSVIAKIPRYKQENVIISSSSFANKGEEVFYLDREFKSEEEAIELSILFSDGKILRTDRSVNYEEFMKR